MARPVKVTGYREFVRACDLAGKESKKEVRDSLRKVGDIVKVDAASKLSDHNVGQRTVTGLRTIVRTRGVSVEQTRRKTTGKHPEFGGFQMRKSLIPALEDNTRAVDTAMGEALDRIADHFERS